MSKIEVILRMCNKSALSGDNSRPPGFSKEIIFQNLLKSRDENTNITVLFDGDVSNHWINKYDIKVVQFTGGNGDSSFVFQINYIKSQCFPDDTIIYILEDDYSHKEGWTTILREGLGQLNPSCLKFDYVTLYDHKDKYTSEWYTNLHSRIGISESIHWRTVPSTTNTFAMKNCTFIQDFDIQLSYLNRDHDKFLELGNRGRLLGSCIPGYSTHSHIDFMSPFF
jgi:hypothetical protein